MKARAILPHFIACLMGACVTEVGATWTDGKNTVGVYAKIARSGKEPVPAK